MSSRYREQSVDAIDPLETMPPAKKSMVIFFLVDTSKSMEGTKLDSLNKVMGEILPELIGVGEAGTDVKVAVLSFSSGCEWVTPEPVLVEEYQRWENLKADGVTDLGEACGLQAVEKRIPALAVPFLRAGDLPAHRRVSDR